MSLSSSWPRAAAYIGLGLLGGLFVGDKLIGQPVLPLPQPAGNAPALPRDWMSYAPVVKRALPAVVCIESKDKPTKPKLEDPDASFGSGAIIDASGIVLTNSHLVAGTTIVEVTLQDGRKFISKDIRRDPKTDIAVLKIESKDPFPFLEFGDSSQMEVGDRVLALGAPFGLTGSVSQGIVSARARQNLNLNVFEDFLQVDAAVNPGNSGGPLVSMEGKLVGLTSAIKTRSGGFQGIGLAVSSNLAKDIAAKLIKDGNVRRPYLGVLVRELDEDTAAKQKIKVGAGVVVTRVLAKSPGEKANLGVGDVITSVGGQPVPTPRDLQKVTASLPVGEPAEVLVMRNGKLFLTKATIEEQPEPAGPVPGPPLQAAMSFDALGIAVTSITDDVANRLGLPKTVKGVVISGVTKGGLAEQSGLGRNMVIVQVDKFPVTTAEEFQQAIERAGREKGAVVHVLRPNGDVDFVILRGQ